MPTGKVKFVKPAEGYGFICPDDGSGDVHFRLEPDKRALLYRNLAISYEVTTNERGQPAAIHVEPLCPSDVEAHEAAGTVKFFNPEKGFGFVIPETGGADLYLARRSTIFADGQEPAEGDQVVARYVNTGEQNPVVTHLQITKIAAWRPTGIPLFDYAEMGSRGQLADQLAALAEPENWDHRREPTGGRPILDSYLRFTFVRLLEEEKVLTSGDETHSSFNTGLVTPLQEEIFALYSRSTAGRQPWQFLGFRKRSDRTFLTHFGDRLPELPNYFDEPSVLLYDRRLQLHINIDHVIEHLERFPDPLRSTVFLARQAVQAAEVNTRSRVYRNYKAAIPQWYRDSHSKHADIQLLLPLCLQQPDQADLALVVDRIGNSYRGNTVLTLDMAYKNARLLARPDSDWLIP